MAIEKIYNPAETEAKLYERWEKSGAFTCDPNSKAEPFCIMMPPPNVTGSLHMGHALTFTLQDILIRYRRMQGRDALWQPGTDHAGIATQMMVEKQLLAEGKNMSRREMGREKFLARVWQWKKESGDTITKQLRRLGASCDWSREKFTMDPELSRAVTHEFVTLYREGLIYKDKRLVNWDPKLLTAVSDLEVEQKEIRGHMWYFKYPINGSDEFITIGTTRPDTLPSDVAVAVHPKDERHSHFIGKMVRHPIRGVLIPIIADEIADPEKGTGALKISPGHDFKDFEVGKRHKLPMLNIFDQHAKLNAEVPEKYRGIDRFEARKRIVADMEAMGLLDRVEPHTHTVPHGDRSGVVIEPWLSEQWYCDAKTLAIEAIKAVETGKTKFVPEQWANTYYAWMRNIEPWCISRQLWWGHQIPAWYGPDGKFFVAENENDAKAEAQKHYSIAVELKRDEDVLDTWFSSALWPFSTLGWPKHTLELKRYYPSDVLVTGFDIIFFWVARMMMMGLHFMKDVPFETVYIHALVRDEKGQKMSKTKGNVIDPLDVIEKYGCDALRFTLANMSTPGRDIKLASARIEGNRNFATKLWNAARYCQMNGCEWKKDFDPADVKQTVNQWIIGETKLATEKIAGLLDEYRFDLASSAAYDFVWNNFCDWYLEFTKPIIAGADDTAKAETRATTAWALGQMLHFLHPFMPYITEELWSQLDEGMLLTAKWPALADKLVVPTGINWTIGLIEKIRATRVELNVPAAAKIELLVMNAVHKPQVVDHLMEFLPLITKMARLKDDGIPMRYVTELPKGVVQIPYGQLVFAIPLADVIDLEQERARLVKEIDKWKTEVDKVVTKLGNKNFVDRAPPEVIEEHQTRKAEAEAMLAKLQAAQRSLSA